MVPSSKDWQLNMEVYLITIKKFSFVAVKIELDLIFGGHKVNTKNLLEGEIEWANFNSFLKISV